MAVLLCKLFLWCLNVRHVDGLLAEATRSLHFTPDCCRMLNTPYPLWIWFNGWGEPLIGEYRANTWNKSELAYYLAGVTSSSASLEIM